MHNSTSVSMLDRNRQKAVALTALQKSDRYSLMRLCLTSANRRRYSACEDVFLHAAGSLVLILREGWMFVCEGIAGLTGSACFCGLVVGWRPGGYVYTVYL